MDKFKPLPLRSRLRLVIPWAKAAAGGPDSIGVHLLSCSGGAKKFPGIFADGQLHVKVTRSTAREPRLIQYSVLSIQGLAAATPAKAGRRVTE